MIRLQLPLGGRASAAVERRLGQQANAQWTETPAGQDERPDGLVHLTSHKGLQAVPLEMLMHRQVLHRAARPQGLEDLLED